MALSFTFLHNPSKTFALYLLFFSCCSIMLKILFLKEIHMKLDNSMILILCCVIVATVATLAFVFVLFTRVMKIKVANKDVSEIGSYIEEGAMAFLKREYSIIIPITLGVAVILAAIGFIPGLKDAESVGWKAALCFLVGATFSGLAGFVGMKAAVKANSRTTSQAMTDGMPGALNTAITGGGVLGLSVAGFGLLGLTVLFLLFAHFDGIQGAVKVISGYGFGCSFIALFARVGGGIFTKAADVGADLVGKVEAGIPEDDPRNPAVIADNVGDNVGDIAGMGSDLCESYVGSLVSALALGLVLVSNGVEKASEKLMFIFMIAALGVLSAVMAIAFVRMKKWHKPQLALTIATYVANGIVLLGALIVSIVYVKDIKSFLAVAVGLAAGILMGKIAEIYTSGDYKHVKEIASQSETGHATNIIAGFAVGMQSTGLTVLVLALGVLLAYFFNDNFGIALAAVGMLSTVAITVSVDGYGPISDNAGGIAEMAHLDKNVRKITDKLDSVGNTTAAIGKGFCIGSATFTAIALFLAYKEASGLEALDAIKPNVVIGILIGAMLPFFFTSLTIKSVGRAANKMIDEVRKQFKNDPGIMAGTSKPDYRGCVDISTKAALREMIIPSLIAVASPILGGFILGADGLGGLLIGGLVSAVMLAVFMANAGGAWDNAKKYIEEGNLGGKGSETHKAAVTGDTVGDPFKDTSGPAMDILIKLMSVIALIIAPILANDNVRSLWDLIVEALNK